MADFRPCFPGSKLSFFTTRFRLQVTIHFHIMFPVVFLLPIFLSKSRAGYHYHFFPNQG